MLVAGMNPCPCGNLGSRKKECRCSPNEIKRYLGRISGPLLDRIDLQVEMDAVSVEEIQSSEKDQPEDSLTVRERVMKARNIQQERYSEYGYFCNAQLDQAGIEKFCILQDDAKKLLLQAVERFHISMRTYGRILKVARTIADLAGHEEINISDVSMAIQYRNVEGRYWR